MRSSLFVAWSVGLFLVVFTHAARGDDGNTDEAAARKVKVASVVIKGSFPESAGSLSLFGDLEPNLRDMVRRLDEAGGDENLSAIVLKIRGASLGRGKLEELRAAIARLREKGKKVVAEMESAEAGDYLLACACDEIIMPESGTLMIPGIRAEVTYFGGLLEMVGVEADLMQVGDYKGAAEPLTRRNMSKQFREQYELLIDDLYEQMIDTIATDRKLDKTTVKNLIDTGLFTAAEAKKVGLIDEVAYGDDLDNRLKQHLSADEIETVADYGKKKVDTDFSGMMGVVKLFDLMMGGEPKERKSKTRKVALIYAVGAITTGSSTTDIFGVSALGSDTIVKALREANEDESVVAIVLRVDSPGGSALASDLIWREITQIDKPVIASMGDTAASGGYYISMGCDKIYAEPGTLTGSIGVVGGKLAVGNLMNKVGLNTEVISRGKNSGLFSIDAKFNDDERAVWQKMMQETYRQFTEKAAEGRKMDVEKLEQLAAGRVWTGRQAKDNGLVDQLGTLRDALHAAKETAGIGEDEKVELLVLPKPTSFLDQLLGAPEASMQLANRLDALLPNVSGRLGQIEMLRKLFTEPSVLLMPHLVEIK